MQRRVTLTFDLLTPKVDRFISCPCITRATLQQNRWIRIQTILFTTSFVTNERTDDRQIENIMPPASLAWGDIKTFFKQAVLGPIAVTTFGVVNLSVLQGAATGQ